MITGLVIAAPIGAACGYFSIWMGWGVGRAAALGFFAAGGAAVITRYIGLP